MGEDNAVKFWITKRDAEAKLIGSVMRLMELFNIKIEKVEAHIPLKHFYKRSLRRCEES
jgi:hypothetical protein